jgi:hypothetical protein
LLFRFKVNYAEFDKECITVNIALKMQPLRIKRGIVKAELNVLAICDHWNPLEYTPSSEGGQ